MSKIMPYLTHNRPGRVSRGSMLKKTHPWYAGYALPRNVWDESSSGGSLVTRGARRGTGRGGPASVSPGRARGTIMQTMRNQFHVSSLSGNTVGGSSLGDYEPLENWLGDAARATWGGIKTGAKAVASLTCKMSDAGLLDKALGAAGAGAGSLVTPGVGTAVGAKAGIAAANALAKKCGRPPISQAAVAAKFGPAVASSYNPGGIKPIHLAIGGAALVGLFLVLR